MITRRSLFMVLFAGFLSMLVFGIAAYVCQWHGLIDNGLYFAGCIAVMAIGIAVLS